ncbi:cation-dependent mannose-6-phosphate receptor [Astyanax mexicanus]|uniref:Cation-dependent mannose-6-phosphate receptor n=1 Tax=Astyanax mexicanus TaxID=7994 RepID=A0A3B1K6D3_ASTMX|nr:cation-dependent mannose-6-phosphate receptor [Astyanax mexicanus]XP_022529230.1 cation-dependent mannose-6-phosphate receptor [Astyanax mexicanus]
MLLSWRAVILLVFLAYGGQASKNTKKCRLSVENAHERNTLSLLEPLTNQSFTGKYVNGTSSYTYIFRVCDDVEGKQGAGVIQKELKDGKPITTLIGSYNDTQAIKGSDWIMLIYRGGEKYDTHCSKEERKAIIMLSCNKSAVVPELTVVLEQRERLLDCFYLFELDSSALCPVTPSQLSAGSILLIIGFSCLAVYLIGGFLYQRLVVGAKGVEQFPNYAFWSEIGNLSADGCDFVCRSRGRREESPAYRGVSTEPLEEPEERDDHLLPM